MKKSLTTQQTKLIKEITAEFQRINAEQITVKKSFNLIDADEYNREALEVKANHLEAENDRKLWAKIAATEAERVLELLQQDLPHGAIARMYKPYNDKIEIGIISQNCWYDALKIYVNVETKATQQSFGMSYHKGVRLLYRTKMYHDALNSNFSTIEALFNDCLVKKQIREVIFSKLNY